ncbi:MAG: hypothetical protein ACSLFK_01560 [Gemmatimonadaceae bacterium]
MRKTGGLLAVLALGLVGCLGLRAPAADAVKPSRYLYVWAGTGHHEAGIGMVAVFDADPSSDKYGSIIDVLTVDSAAQMPHHTEFSAPTNATSFFANDFGADRSYIIDFSDPARPRLAGETAKVPGAKKMHSFARLPNGNVLATLQFGEGKIEGDPGALAEFDKHGKLVRSGSSADKAFPTSKIRTYGLTALPGIDRAVTTSTPMGDEVTEHVVQVWRLSTLELLKTLPVPRVAGDTLHMYPFELRTMADGKTVMLNSYFCGFYRIAGLETSPTIERLTALQGFGCSVPYITGNLMLMPIAYGHRIVTLDISNPDKPVELASLATDTTFFPHWVSGDPGSDRVVMTDQGDGSPRVMIGILDRATGRITWDEKFRDAGSDRAGVSLENVAWPNGVKGKVMAHGALFIP